MFCFEITLSSGLLINIFVVLLLVGGHGIWQGLTDKASKTKEETGLKFISERKHKAVLGGGDHDYVPHTESKCTRHTEAFKKFKATYKRVYGGYRGLFCVQLVLFSLLITFDVASFMWSIYTLWLVVEFSS